MRSVYLYGTLAQKYGKVFKLHGNTIGAIVNLLEANFPGFKRYVMRGEYRVVAGKSLEDDKGIYFDNNLARSRLNLGSKDLHILPVPEGSGGNFGRIVLGAALVAAAFYFAPAVVGAAGPTLGLGTSIASFGGFSITFQTLALFGASMALGGVAGLLTPSAKVGDYSSRETPDQRASFMFNGAVNSVEQGGPVPVVYGKHLVGSVVMAGSINVEQI